MSDPSETVFTYASPRLRFGPGASDEIWHDLTQLGARRVLVVTDPVLATGAPDRVADQLSAHGIEAVVHDTAHVEPTDASMAAAVTEPEPTGVSTRSWPSAGRRSTRPRPSTSC